MLHGLPELESDYRRIKGFNGFFSKLGAMSRGSFRIDVVDTRPVGDEFVVIHVRNQITLKGTVSQFDAVVIWRVFDGKCTQSAEYSGDQYHAVNTGILIRFNCSARPRFRPVAMQCHCSESE